MTKQVEEQKGQIEKVQYSVQKRRVTRGETLSWTLAIHQHENGATKARTTRKALTMSSIDDQAEKRTDGAMSRPATQLL